MNGKYLGAVPSLQRCVEAYIEGRYERGEIRQETRRSFRETLRAMVVNIERGQALPIASVRKSHIQEWIAGMNVADATKRLRISTARTFFRWARIEGLMTTDPMAGVRPPKKPRVVPRSITDEQVVQLLWHAADSRERLMVLLMVQEGLRGGELARIQLGDVDFANLMLTVHGKGGHMRVVPISPQTHEAIQAYLGLRGRSTGPLIHAYQQSYANPGEGITPKYSARLVCDIFRRAGIPESSHVLRHTAAHRMTHEGAPIRVVQTALGHASLSSTEIYQPWADVRELRKYMGLIRYAVEGTTSAPGKENPQNAVAVPSDCDLSSVAS